MVKVEGLSVIYNLGKTNEAVAISEVTLDVYPHEYVIIYGPSGCGKSTLLYCLTGLEVPTRGKVLIANNDISQMTPEELVNIRRLWTGIIFQAYNLIPTLSVLDNVTLPQTFGSISTEIKEKKAHELLKQFGIDHLSNKYPNQLSGGQQQRVAIARALTYYPPILIADEPTGNLDSASAEVVMNLLAELNEKRGKTIILVTHNAFHLRYAHRIFYMKDGKIVRVVRNPEKKSATPTNEEERISSEIEALARLYPHLSQVQLQAKALSQYLLTNLTELEIERIEAIVAKRVSGKINRSQFETALNLPFSEGGAGLYVQKAREFASKVEEILAKSEFIQEEVPSVRPLSGLDIKVQEARRYLLEGYDGSLKREEEINRLDHFIRLRMESKINKRQFTRFLDMPFKKGGVGLNRRTARNFTRDLELVLIKYK
ncbi:ABC transporter ATP-binding protein [bacterium]|nr:ABC transporter ATP-binding protein [bacterium]